MSERTYELRQRLADVRERIGSACRDAGRDGDQVTLIVVTKTYPASDVAALAQLGVTDVGENRHPEAADKYAELADRASGLRWHFVGAVQTNKARQVAAYADCVHSVDRTKLVRALSRAAQAHDRPLDVLLQVSLDPPRAGDGRSGVAPGALLGLAADVASAEGLRLAGVMAVAPVGADPRPAFERLAQCADRLRREHPQAAWISAGMSGDLEAAIAAGATHVRIGRAVLGERPSLG